ncbi:MAG: sugar ABC transporter permease [Oscillospiraceae bacterium]|nr:sugar ABC transporter permease [Oscillospiraceae bacterium]
MIYPLIYTFILSLQGNGKKLGEFVGFDNYRALLFGGSDSLGLHQEAFWSSMGRTLILWAGNFVVQIILSLLLAVWFSDSRIKVKGAGFFKVAMYMPNIITAASVASMMVMLFAGQKDNAINSMLLNLGIIGEPFDFISDEWASRIIVMFVQSWMWYGNTMLLLMSGIFGIDTSIYEAASIDGSSGMHTFINITMPILKPIFIYVFITSMIGGLQMFDIPYLFHTGADYKPHLETAAVYIFRNFRGSGNILGRNHGLAAAASMILFVITVALGIFIFKFNSESTGIKKRKKKG